MPSFTIEPETIDFEFEVYCERCGAGLCMDTTVTETTRRRMPALSIKPCSKCLSDEKDEGYDEGYKSGVNDGFDDGYKEGLKNADN